MLLCRFKNIFGEPRKGVHSIRLFDFAVIDVILTILLALIISYAFKIGFLFTFFILFLIAQVFHLLFCVQTKFVELLGITF
ncbi:hypothetical protein QKU48_gp1274 [Fadolivirus algeromassiliense]|jgi:hypothetical protein|uniref:Uncharacterized protein n=1 Tax=Fadolivirus FV1/VV64 TaxID=3070911 RepID=A0A7D3V618_9VIRU|nr:hypothetical protein QKU48_gp1274 [Fadolivirus algeromassiliense]QKF94732.1 hypothetical protein Fadolivirus_1_1274 [Fadolivirus FV1/VV64]